MATSGRAGQSDAKTSGSAPGSSQTPTSPRARSASLAASHRVNGTMLGVPGTSESEAASRSSVQGSSTIAPFLMSRGIHPLLERLEPDALHGVGEALVVEAPVDIDLDQGRDHVRHLARRKRWTDDPA